MTAAEFRRIEELFSLAVELPTEERSAFLDRHCGGDGALRARLLELLEQDDQGTRDSLRPLSPSASRTRTPAGADASRRGTSSYEAGATHVDRYRILDKLGEGGMGVVFRAEQVHPIRRIVALKIVRAGLDTARVLQRFEYERQALARMEHPGIAKILDAGSTENGRPYFAMELVAGSPITAYCAARELSIRERLEMFATVCDAIQHAHHKGVVHRDIKPTNVLVVDREGHGPEVKVIDFGIACDVLCDAAERRDLTEKGEVLGTYWYMAPEQADPDALGFDSRTDIYALGVLLYELLSGVLPFPAERLRGQPLTEVRRILCEEEPIPPSVAATRANRESEDPTRAPPSRSRAAPGIDRELDWIVLKAMEKQRERRYASASELAADVQRYLRGEVVTVGPPDRLYRLRRVVRRHRVTVVATAIAVFGLVTGLMFAVFSWLEAGVQRDDANSLRRTEFDLRVRAEKEKEGSQRVTRFLIDTLSMVDPGVSLDPGMTAQELLERVAKRIDASFANDSRGEAALQRTIGIALQSLGVPEAAQTHLHRALELYEADASAPLEDAYATIRALWQTHLDDDSQEALLSYRADLLACRCIAAVAPELAESLRAIVDPGGTDGKTSSSSALPNVEARLAAGVPAKAKLMAADVLFEVGRFNSELLGRARGIPYLELSLKTRRAGLPEDHPDIGHSAYRLALALLLQDRIDDAETHLSEARLIFDRSLPAAHWIHAAVDSARGECLSRRGRPEDATEAELLLVSGRTRIVQTRGAASEVGLLATRRLLAHLRRGGRSAEAEPLRQDLAMAMVTTRNTPYFWNSRAAAFGPEHEPLVTLMNQFDRRMSSGPRSELASMVEPLIETRRKVAPDDQPLAAVAAGQFVDWSYRLRHVEAAARVRLSQEAVRILEGWSDENPTMLGHARLGLARAELDANDSESSVRDAKAALEIFASRLGARSYEALEARVAHARALAASGNVDQARDLATALLLDVQFVYGDDNPQARKVKKLLQSITS